VGGDHGGAAEQQKCQRVAKQARSFRLVRYVAGGFHCSAIGRPSQIPNPWIGKLRPSSRLVEMKTGIHPEYMLSHVHCSCGNDFYTRSTEADLHVELCSECHPFYTGKQKLVDTGGRVERFQRRAAKHAKASR
jgi:large subunit ribosomal protein L31